MPSGIYKRNKEMKTGKHMIGRKLSLSTKKKMSKVRKGTTSGFKKGNIPWNKGKNKFNDIRVLKYAKKHIGKKISEKTRKKLSESHKGQVVSERCKKINSEMCKKRIGKLNPNFGKKHSIETRKKMSKSQKGEKGSNWQGGKSYKNNIIRNSVETRLWREAVFARDNYTCQKCKTKGIYLNAHHIKNFAKYPELRFSIDNGITFCKECHRKFHKKYGNKDNNRNQISEYLKDKIIYAYACFDILHIGHINHLKRAKEQGGFLIVGILNRQAILEKKQEPVISFKERIEIAKAIRYVDKAITQKTYSPIENIKLIKPDILMESDSHDPKDLKETIKFVKSYGGKVVMSPYYKGQSSTKIKNKIKL